MDRVKITEAVCEPTPAPTLHQPLRPPEVTSGTILTLAAACGLLVANIYYAQPLIAGVPPAKAVGAPIIQGRALVFENGSCRWIG